MPKPALLLLLVFLTSPALAQTDWLELSHDLSMELETPHTDWGQPYAGGATRVLFFTTQRSNGMATRAREIIELMQRFDVQADAVYHHNVIDSSTQEWVGDSLGEERALRLLATPYDVYLFQYMTPADLSTEAQYTLLDAVTKGAGLVLVGSNDDRVLKPERQITDLPPFLATGPVGEAFDIIDGRGIRLPARPSLGYDPGWEVTYDHWQERLGRAVLWAAGKEPEMQLAIEAPPETPRADLPCGVATIAWSNAPAGVSLETTLRRADGKSIQLAPTEIAQAEGEQFIEAPPLRAGVYHIDIRALDDGKVAAWATAPFTVGAAESVEEIVLNQEWAEVGDTISGTVTLTGDAASEESLRIQAIDRRGRVVAQQTGSASFEFTAEAWSPMLLRIEATLMDGDNEVAGNHAFARVTRRNRDRFNFLMWDYSPDTLGPYAQASMADLGVSLTLQGGHPSRLHSAYETAWVPYTTRIMNPRDDNGVMQPACWNDEEAIQAHVDGIVSDRVPDRGHGAFVYSLGDETVTRGSCLHPACLAAYQDYLEVEYGTIEALNESWATDFADFEAIVLTDPADNDENSALRANNYPRWYDRQAYQCYNFVQLCKRFGDAFREIDPQARTGFEGAGRFGAGDDIDLIVRTNGFWSPYPGTADEVIRSIADRDFPRSNWMGYTKDANSLLSRYWRMITRGNDSVWWWRWDGLGRFHGFLAPHLGPWPATQDLVDDTKVVRDGLGTLLTHSEMLDDGIAVLYSMPSAYACKVEHGTTYGNFESAHTAWSKTLRELGLQYRYVTDRMLRLGEFPEPDIKLLILPRAEAIGPVEAQVIRDFVEGGGSVIADVRPGIYDGHCKPLEKGCLDDLFGVTRGPQAESAKHAGDGLEGLLLDPSVQLAGGEATQELAGAPSGISHAVGKGQAILLNYAAASCPDLGAEDTPELVAQSVLELYKSAGVEPTVSVQNRDGTRLRNTETIRWRNGNAEILALFNEGMGIGWLDESEGESAVKARVTLPAARHVYDLRNHTYLGRQESFEAEVIPSRATFFALLPDEAPPIRLSLAERATPGDVVTAKLSVPGLAGLHAVRIEATAPDGSSADWLDKVLLVSREGAEVALPIALNDPPGEWTIDAIDLYTEEATTATLTVEGE